jgi:hypothetical protein
VLAIEDLVADLPVEPDQLAVDGEYGTGPGSPIRALISARNCG